MLNTYFSDNQLKCYKANPPIFKKGQIVKVKITRLKGMVLQTINHCNSGWLDDHIYRVRFQIITEKTNTHLISDDSNIEVKPFAIERMFEYELEAVNI